MPLLLLSFFTLADAASQSENRIKLEPVATAVSAGSVTYKFMLLDSSSSKMIRDSDLVVAHEKKLHMIIYDSSLTEFQHIHPEFDGKIWSATAQFSANGDYWVWAQGELNSDRSEFSASTKLLVSGGSPTKPLPPSLADARTGTSGLSRVSLSSGRLMAGKMAMLDLTMSRTDGTKPVLTPYMGAFAHIIATPSSGDSLIHVHPVTTGDAKGMIHATFPKAGSYRLWIQYIDAGTLKEVPLAVKVF